MSVALTGGSVTDLGAAYRRGDWSPADAVEAAAARIEELDPVVHAFAELRLDEALDEARASAERLARGEDLGPLHGIPVAVKELIDVGGMVTTYGSEVFRDHVPSADAVAVVRMRAAGAIVVGTTRSHEFGWGITSQHPTRGGVRNPWDPSRIPGGSSGGSAAAVAASMVPVAVGTDTGGSVRIPAAFCGVVGLKATHGRINPSGVMPLAPSLDSLGALARNARDAQLCVRAMSDCRADAEEVRVELPVRLGYPDELRLSREYRELWDALLSSLSDAGCELVAVALDGDSILSTFVPIQLGEGYDQHARALATYPRHEARYGEDVRARLELGSQVSIGDYLRATRGRQLLAEHTVSILQDVDALINPVSSAAPPLLTDPDHADLDGQRMALRELVLPNTVLQNLLGLPAIAACAGCDQDGLPFGYQLTTRRGEESRLTALARFVASGREPRARPTIQPAPGAR